MSLASPVTVVRETRLDPRFPLSGGELRALCETLLDALGLDGRTFSLKLVDDREIARLNREFLGCTGPTNILSFPAHDPDDPELPGDEGAFLGELALSVDTLARETDLYGQTPLEHLARLLAHGLLHLAGFDHGEIMFDMTDAAVDRALLEHGGAA
ncbi:rRNA maturation RNase YbeY [Pseudodesulfovibrio indicus]|uniref:Endoribonuclease YbeY n=1 Tax=Pseudodesulfovibrio indicus TaxID=1716143 RepID=A0A126QMT2_9BACT|nr:rRNA maturation RNase YbeY [Pseudodesulfovibrio indicus]AMK11393.1 rRNA maturation RNase YbeY [Pseudodesulfovibrio indicus]TDT89784.1 putative rRNA maturation factor [Pseudodesulfovibrio indicus]